MAAIIKKIKKGKPYYYAVQSARVDGKPRIVWQKYLGTIDAIIDRAEHKTAPAPKEAVIFEAGGVAALLHIAQQLGLTQLIDEVVPKRDQGPTVGQYILLAALNRALAPCSKLAIGCWYEQTILRRLWRFDKSAFSSQRFWDHMDMISEKDLAAIEERLLPRIAAEFGLDPQLLLYDTTNFFTFLSTHNERAQLPQRGRSKAHRNDLRQVGLALLVERDHQIPLLHRVYPGNIPDISLFPQLARELLDRYAKISGGGAQATLVFDKGNVCEQALENLIVAGAHFIAALPADRLPELIAAPPEKFIDLPGIVGSKAFIAEAELCAKPCRVVVVYTESFFTQQLSGVTANLVRCQKKLLDLGKTLEKWRNGKGRGRKPTTAAAKKSVREMLAPQFMKELISWEVTETNGLPQLKYAVDHAALRRLEDERLGRTLLVSDRLDWDAAEVVRGYRSLTEVEAAFRNMKNDDFLHWQPSYHWTDQKLRVHGFYCVLALLLATLARKMVVSAGVEISLPALLKELSQIREVAVIYPPEAAAPKNQVTISRMSAQQRKLANLLQIGKIIA